MSAVRSVACKCRRDGRRHSFGEAAEGAPGTRARRAPQRVVVEPPFLLNFLFFLFPILRPSLSTTFSYCYRCYESGLPTFGGLNSTNLSIIKEVYKETKCGVAGSLAQPAAAPLLTDPCQHFLAAP